MVDDGQLVGLVSIRDMLSLAQVLRVEHPGAIEARRGLEGVVVAETEVGDVRGQEGFYHYRQYNAVELAEKRSLEDVWHLLYEGHLPTPRSGRRSPRRSAALRDIPASVKGLLPAIATAGEHFIPLDALRTAYSLLAYALDFKSWLDISKEELRANAMQTSAVMPTLIMALYRLNQGLEPIDPQPRPGLRGQLPLHAHRRGARPRPRPGHRAVPDLHHRPRLQLLDLHRPGDHLHRRRPRLRRGGRHRRPVRPAARRRPQPGPRHARRHRHPRQGRGMDPRLGQEGRADHGLRPPHLQDRRPPLAHAAGRGHRLGGDMVEFAKQVEKTVVDVLAELKPGRHLYANVEFYAGVVMDKFGIPRKLFTPTFTSSRVIGWCAHMLEQAADNRLIRPAPATSARRRPSPCPTPERAARSSRRPPRSRPSWSPPSRLVAPALALGAGPGRARPGGDGRSPATILLLARERRRDSSAP